MQLGDQKAYSWPLFSRGPARPRRRPRLVSSFRELEDIHKARFIGDDLNFGIFESQRVDDGPAPKQIPKAHPEEQLSRAHKGSRGKTGMIGYTELFGGKADSSEEARFEFLEMNFRAENFLQFLVNLIQILVG